MTHNEPQNWDDLLRIIANDVPDAQEARVSVRRRELEEITSEMSRLVFATERRFQDSADRLLFEHRERSRRDLIHLNNLRLRLRALLGSAK